LIELCDERSIPLEEGYIQSEGNNVFNSALKRKLQSQDAEIIKHQGLAETERGVQVPYHL